MLEIPINANLSVDQAVKEIQDFANGLRSTLDGIVDPKGRVLRIQTEFTSTGEKVIIGGLKNITKGNEALEDATRKAEAATKKSLQTQTGSATSLRQSVNALKQQRDALVRGSEAWLQYDARIRQAAGALRAQQGIQVGSLTDLRRQRDELIKLRDATNKFSGPGFDDLSKQIRQLDGQINALTPGFNKFFNVLGKIATVQAGFIAITSAIGAITGVVNSYVNRTKQVEAFNLALKNVGLTQTETTNAFREATTIANRLGAPIQQVEKAYQRMVPALRAVGADSAKSSKFIENITARTQTLGLNTEQSGRLLEAFAQVLSKGKLQAEELNQQISELDGAFRTQLADALGVTVEKLTELTEQGAITAPVFVDAINKMANGVEELQRRVESGNATIQQFQNLIGNINVQILQEIGKQIEPGIRAFLRLSLAVSEFFKSFTQTEAFATLATIFNQTAKGIEVFVSNLLKAISAINTILSPVFTLINSILELDSGFGGLIGLVINLAGGLLILKGAFAGFKLVQTVTASIGEFSKALIAAGNGVNYLADKAKPGFFDLLAQRAENTRAGIAGLGQKAKEAAFSFVGFNSNVSKTTTELNKATSAAFKFNSIDYLKAKQGLNPEIAQRYAQEIDASYTKVRTSAAKVGASSKELVAAFYEQSAAADPAAKSTSALGNATEVTGTKAAGAAGKLRSFASAAKSAIAAIGGQLIIAAVVAGIGQLVAAYQNASRVEKEYADSSKSAIEELIKTQENYKNAVEDVRKTVTKSTQSYEEAKKSIDQTSKAAQSSGNAWSTLSGTLFTVAGIAGITALTIGTGGLGGAVIAAGIGATAAAGGFAAAGKAAKELEKSAQGRGLLESAKNFDKAAKGVTATIQGLGGKVGQVDFKQFAKGSVNLNLLRDQYAGLLKATEEYIAAKEEQLKTELAALQAEEDPQKRKEIEARVAALRGEIAAKKEVANATEASLQAISDEIALRIAAGDSAARQAASVEELTEALKLQNEAIEASAIEAKTAALEKYGKLQSQAGQLEAANLAIELAASRERKKANEDLLKSLQDRMAKGGEEAVAAKKAAASVTKTIAEESLKQAELQKQVGDAIVEGFERGIQKAKEITDVYGGIASGAKQTFDNITGSLTSGIQAALSLVDAVASVELEGLEKGSIARKRIIIEQLRAAAIANQVEADIAQLKLAVQNRIAQNEAKIAQLRFQNEAKIAAARGDFDLASAYREAAGAQGQIIQGLQTAYEIESKSIDIQRQAKDQALIQKGLQEGIGNSARSAASFIGVQAVSLKDASQQLQDMSKNARGLSQEYGQAAISASQVQGKSAEVELSRGEQEAENIKNAFQETLETVNLTMDSLESMAEVSNQVATTANTLSGAFDSAAVSGDSLIQVMKRTDEVGKGILSTINAIDAVLASNTSGGSRRGAALPARAQGGPVLGGQQYLVNDGGGREAFMNTKGQLSMLPAARNIRWTAPSSGTIIPANYVDQYRRASRVNKEIASLNGSIEPGSMRANAMTATLDSGNLIQRVASAMTNSGGTQRITNNVTIQSQEPVTDASKIMTNVARMRLRNARGI